MFLFYYSNILNLFRSRCFDTCTDCLRLQTAITAFSVLPRSVSAQTQLPPFLLTSTLVSSFPCSVGHFAPRTRLVSLCALSYTVKTRSSPSRIEGSGFLGLTIRRRENQNHILHPYYSRFINPNAQAADDYLKSRLDNTHLRTDTYLLTYICSEHQAVVLLIFAPLHSLSHDKS
jgi:hypothetical protein